MPKRPWRIMLRSPCCSEAAQTRHGAGLPWKTWGGRVSRARWGQFSDVAPSSPEAAVRFVARRGPAFPGEGYRKSPSTLEIQGGRPTNDWQAGIRRCCAANQPAWDADCCGEAKFLRIRESAGVHCRQAPFVQPMPKQRVASRWARREAQSWAVRCLLRTRSPTSSSLWLRSVGG